ncbi:MAG: J domain-containing protein [Polyangiaceae bacterium]|nr:J domain-containing protein [Polyangiaceae bacterium]
MKTHYDTLQVSRTATLPIIKAAYRSLVIAAHPDQGGNVEAFDELQTAYTVLSDPQKRAEYDAQLLNVGFEDRVSQFADDVLTDVVGTRKAEGLRMIFQALEKLK